MDAYVTAEKPAIRGMNARVTMLFVGPSITFTGVSGDKRGEIIVNMHPEDAIGLAWDLLMCAEAHGKDTRRRVEWVRKRLNKAAERAASSSIKGST